MKKLVLMALCLIGWSSCTFSPKSPADYVDPFIGTGFHGHTYPGATLPNGAVQLSPDTRRGGWDGCSGYHYSDSTILGFSHTHLSGTGCADLADVLLRPTTQPISLGGEGDIYRPASFSHQNEVARPGYYLVEMDDEQIKAELTATTYVGMHRYTFNKAKNASVILDLAHSIADWEQIYNTSVEQTAENEITGMRHTLTWVDNQYVYFVAQFSKPIKNIQYVSKNKEVSVNGKLEGNDIQAVLSFGDEKEVIVKVGLSVVSAENARENLAHDVSGFDFDAVSNSAYAIWNDVLSKVKVKGGTEAQLKNFYTAWYHALVVPNTVSDVNGQYRRHDMKIANMEKGKKMYSTFSIWDTFRGWHPLMTLTNTDFVNDMVQSFLNMYEATGELPIWPLSAGETSCMIGYHSVSVIADAYLKGIRGFDAEKALQAMIVSSEINKKNAAEYIQYGYIPSNRRESVSCLLEYAYDDWAIAQMAKAMGKMDVYETYIARSQNYHHVFDGVTRFFRAKRMDGNWEENFVPEEVGREFTEATAWQYRFFVPHDVNGMINLFGGTEQFAKDLDDLFATTEGVKGHQSDITGLIGQYAHGNEPSHHMAYLYNYIGQPWKTQAWTRRLLDEMYQPTPEGISGNEDCGQMSAWYILSAMGFYSVCPGSNEFVLTTPLFDQVDLTLANGKTLTITANNPQKNLYVDQVTLNGKIIDKNFVTYEQLMEGGTLAYTLTDKPNATRGTATESYPYSYTADKVVSIPSISKDLNLFMDEITFTIASATDGCRIYYTLDGTEPTEKSLLYNGPITLKESKTIKAKAFKEGYVPSHTYYAKATKTELRPARSAQGTQNGVYYEHVLGKFSKVAEFAQAKVVDKGILSEPSLEKAQQEDRYGFTYTGMMLVPEDGVYTFSVKSDDGSMLYIDGEMVVDNDGSHAAVAAMGKIPLKKGYHAFKLLYLEDYEGQELSWSWKLPSKTELEPIPASVLFVK